MCRSETIGELATALAKFQGALEGVAKNSKGYGYDYADLAAVLDAVRPHLAENGLSVVQSPVETEGDGVALQTTLLHSSGEWLSSTFAMPVERGKGMSAAQSVGSVITYARRYALAACRGVAQTDDDGAVQEPAKKADSATEAQLKKLWSCARGYWGDDAKEKLAQMLERRGLPTSTRELTRDRASDIIDQIGKLADTGEVI